MIKLPVVTLSLTKWLIKANKVSAAKWSMLTKHQLLAGYKYTSMF